MVVDAAEPTRSITVTVSIQVPTGAVGPTVTTPVIESILIPVMVGDREKRQEVVPLVWPKAVEVLVWP